MASCGASACPCPNCAPRAESDQAIRWEQTLTQHSGENAIRFETSHGRIDEVYAGRWAEVQLIEGCS
jgi:hypothetical protein